MYKVLLFVFFFSGLINFAGKAQSTRDISVELTAKIKVDTPSIILQWTPSDAATQYQVFRKDKNAVSWGTIRATLDGSAKQYTDTNVEIGKSYEYKITRSGSGFTGYGYINSGIQVGQTDFRGKCILLIDTTYVNELSFYISRLVDDLTGDGWEIITLLTSRTSSPSEIKTKIVQVYNQDKINTKVLFILGHVPVPYSGNINPDGHPDHLGAWPADVFYADMDGNWTDISINNNASGDPRNRNLPGDGKFDQSTLPSNAELQVGRVDFANMPAFQDSELNLIKKYLDKDHAYRHKKFVADKRAVIDDNFGYFSGEAFAASGWRNFGPLVGTENVTSDDYFTSMSDKSYQWSYGCGGGTYTSAGGIGSTDNFKSSDLKGVFTMLFGSYFGDWDAQNNFLRAPLAQGTTLTNVWAGRPHWYFHHMGLGENIGYSVKLTQNNSSLYYTHYAGRFVHISLMGDPTLRNDVLEAVKNLQLAKENHHIKLKWTPPSEKVEGYHVYVKQPNSPNFIKLNRSLIKDTLFTDSCLLYKGNYQYMVRGVKLEITPSGSYYNLSQGITDTIFNDENLKVLAKTEVSNLNNWATFTNASENATDYFWNFGDGTSSIEKSPSHYFPMGEYEVVLIASNECDADTLIVSVNITTGTSEPITDLHCVVTPNPSNGIFKIQTTMNHSDTKVEVFNVCGNMVYASDSIQPDGFIDLYNFEAGVYLLKLSDSKRSLSKKIVIIK